MEHWARGLRFKDDQFALWAAVILGGPRRRRSHRSVKLAAANVIGSLRPVCQGSEPLPADQKGGCRASNWPSFCRRARIVDAGSRADEADVRLHRDTRTVPD